MDTAQLESLREELEAADELGPDLLGKAHQMMAEAIDGKLDDQGIRDALSGSVEHLLTVAGTAFPGWAVSFHGHASAHASVIWRCTLKETRGQDDDQIVGIGNAKSMLMALLGAVTHIQIMRAAGYI